MFRLPKRIESLQPREGGEHRRTGRILTDGIRCSLGKVADISMGGCQVRRTGAPKPEEFEHERNIWIDTPCGGRLHLRAKLVRHKHVGFRKHELGYQYVDVTDDQRRALAEIARGAVRYEHGFGKMAG
ncbi:MAG: PilZ domain-containing protein [Planctomycetota bacterium]